MGIFSFLNQNQDKSQDQDKSQRQNQEKSQNQDPEDFDYTPPVSQPEVKLKTELPDLHREMPVEVLGEDGQVIIKGLITVRNGRDITIGRRPGGLSFKLCEQGSSVVVQGRDNKMAQFYLRAIVAESSRIHMRLTGLVQEIRDNLRDTFRLAMETPISVFYYADTQMKRPENCILLDISTGGCCISSEQLYREGEVLRLRIKLEDYMPMNFVGEVIRVTEHGYKDYRYGILFAQPKKEEQDALTRTLFNLQVGNREEHSRVNGHW